MTQLFLSTPSVRRATSHRPKQLIFNTISIHALREEGDPPSGSTGRQHCDFYPRPPRGRRPSSALVLLIAVRFLSTPSARRATLHEVAVLIQQRISIHALREEGDKVSARVGFLHIDFYPRPP